MVKSPIKTDTTIIYFFTFQQTWLLVQSKCLLEIGQYILYTIIYIFDNVDFNNKENTYLCIDKRDNAYI